MANGIIRRCDVCGTIELGKDVLIPRGKYQLVNTIFSDTTLSRKCYIKQYSNQLTKEQLDKLLSSGVFYDSCAGDCPHHSN